MFRALAWLYGGFIAFAAAFLAAWFGGLGPWGPFPGGFLWGEVASERVADWSFVDRVTEVDPRVRIRVDGKLHAGRAVWVRDPSVLEPLLPAVLRKYHLVETSHAHFVAAPARHPGTQIQHVFFRVDPP